MDVAQVEKVFETRRSIRATEENRQFCRELADFYEESGDDDASRYYRHCSETKGDFLSRPYPRDTFRWLEADDATLENSYVPMVVFAALSGKQLGGCQRAYPTYAEAIRDLGKALKTVTGERE